MNISFYTLGCKLNYAETSQLQAQFEAAGHTVVTFGTECDAVIINTCTVTENADRECRQIVRRALRQSPNAFVGITGCYAQLQPEEIALIDGVDAVFGAKEKFKIPELISHFHKTNTPHCFVSELDTSMEFVESQSSENDSRTRAFLKLQDGCDYKCSFCTIPLARGKSRSMTFPVIRQRVQQLVAEGYHEIVLSGINLGDYQADTGEGLADILLLLDEIKPTARIRLSSIEPNLLTTAIISTIARSRIFCRSFHIPLQSGSPEILRQMRRRYTTKTYKNLMYSIKNLLPDCAIGADIIVGFPGETDEQFEETFTFIQSLPISYLHVFSYSERENTPAAELSRQGHAVSGRIRAERSARLRTLSAEKKQHFYDSCLGEVYTVIPEQYNSLTGLWSGWTENYIRVEFEHEASLPHHPLNVELLHNKGETVFARHTSQPRPQTFVPQRGYIPLLVRQ